MPSTKKRSDECSRIKNKTIKKKIKLKKLFTIKFSFFFFPVKNEPVYLSSSQICCIQKIIGTIQITAIGNSLRKIGGIFTDIP